MQWTVLPFCALALSTPAVAQEMALRAPFQIDGVLQFKSDRYHADDGLSLNRPLIVVDLGEAQTSPYPDDDQLQRMNIVGTRGIATGTLADIRKTCDYPCAELGEPECHYEGHYSLDKPVDAIGTPVAAIPGNIGTADMSRTNLAAAPTVPPDLIGKDFAALVWTPFGADGPRVRMTRWDTEQRQLELEARWRSGDAFSVEGSGCRIRRVDDLTELQCNGAAVILADDALLLFSYPDYNAAAAEVVSTIVMGTSPVYLIRLGLKAQTVFGLLYHHEQGWRGLFRPRGCALLC